MKNPVYFFPVLALLSLVACQRNLKPEDPSLQGREITFTASIGTYTKATASATASSAFENGDVLGLFISGPLTENNVPLTLTDGSFVPQQPLYWAADQREDTPADFLAYYPYANLNIQPDDWFFYSVPWDQSTKVDYESANLLRASVSSAPNQGAVHLQFSHCMSRFCVTVTDELTGDVTYGGQVVMVGLYTDAMVNLAENEVVPKPSEYTSEFFPLSVGENTHVAIVPPQTAQPSIRVRLSNGNWMEYTADSPITFQPGKQIIANLVLKQGKISFSAEVIDWVDEEINFNTGGESFMVDYFLNPTGMRMIEQEDGTFFGKVIFNDWEGISVYDGVTNSLYKSAIPISRMHLEMGESATIPLTAVNGCNISIDIPAREVEMLYAVLDPKTWKLTLTRPGAPEWEPYGNGRFLDAFMSSHLGVPMEEFDVTWERDKSRPDVSFRIQNPYANWSRKNEYGYAEGGCLYLMVLEESGACKMPQSNTGLHTDSGEPINILSSYGLFYSEWNSVSMGEVTVFTGWEGQHYRFQERAASLTFPGGSQPRYYHAYLYDWETGYDEGEEAYYIQYTWDLGYDLLNPRWLVYRLGEGETWNRELIETLRTRLVNGDDVNEENFPNAALWTKKTYVGDPGDYGFFIYGPKNDRGEEFFTYYTFNIEAVNN